MADHEDFRAYARLGDDLIERATKDQLADVARLLAINRLLPPALRGRAAGHPAEDGPG